MRIRMIKPGRHFAEKALSSCFYRLGLSLARYPVLYIIVSVLTMIIFSAATLGRLQYEDDPEYLFAPTKSRSHEEQRIVEDLFPMNSSVNFDVGRATRHEAFGRVIIEAKHGSILNRKAWDDVRMIDSLVTSLSISDDSKSLRYRDLCAKNRQSCFRNEYLDTIAELMPSLENHSHNLSYPLETLKNVDIPTGIIFGGVSLTAKEEISMARATQLHFYLAVDTPEQRKRARVWEYAFMDFMHGLRMPAVNVYYFASRSLATELERNTVSVAPLLTITFVMMLGFTMVACCMVEAWHEAKPWIGFICCVSVILSVVASTGALTLFQMPFIGINLATPYLMLGIGLDDTFVMLAAWRRTNKNHPVEIRTAEMFSDAGVSITITSVTNVLSFMIGAFSPFPSVSIFCSYTALCSAFTFVFQIILIGASIAVWGRFEARRLHGLFGYKMPGVDDEILVIHTSSPTPQDDGNFLRDKYARVISKPPMKIFIIMLFFVYLAGSIYGCSQLREGLDRSKLTLDDSYARDFFLKDDQYFKSYPYRIQIIFNRRLNYTTSDVDKLLDIMDEFQQSPFVNNTALTECWFMEGSNSSRVQDSLRDILRIFTDGRFGRLPGKNRISTMKKDVRWEDKQIKASRCLFQTRNILTSNDEKAMMVEMRRIADSHPEFNITVFNSLFIYFDQFLLVRSTTFQSVAAATVIMIVVALILIPSTWTVFWVALSIVSIEVGVVGFMTLLNVNLDSISMINLIMCIGFSVDYSAHIAHAFIVGTSKTAELRLAETLGSLGTPVVQGALSTLLGIVVFAFVPSYIFLAFFKTIAIVIVFGAVHALLFLPVFLSLTFKE